MSDLVRRAPKLPTHVPMPHDRRGRLGGLANVANNGPAHMAAVGRRGQTGLDRHIAAIAGIPDDAPDRAARLAAAR